MQPDINQMKTDISEFLQLISSQLADIQHNVSHIREDSAQSSELPGKAPIYATLAQMCQLYSMSRDKLSRILDIPVKEGKIRVIHPTDRKGRVGNKSYHLKDFEDFFSCC